MDVSDVREAAPYRPFVVADRPNHLRIIQRAAEQTQNFGVLTRAGVSENVVGLVAELDVPVFVDNGSFADVETEGNLIDLFDTYERMDADYGLIPDAIGERQANNDVFANASRLYERGHPRWSFQGVGVAQGSTLGEYAASMWDLYQMGTDFIAIGGLLEKRGNRSGGHATGRYDLLDTIEHMREWHPRIWERVWTFALGCDHPRRRPRFADLGVSGADSKRWLFQYDGDAARSREDQLVDALVRSVRAREQSGLHQYSSALPG